MSCHESPYLTVKFKFTGAFFEKYPKLTSFSHLTAPLFSLGIFIQGVFSFKVARLFIL
jgi:hypothetical protein